MLGDFPHLYVYLVADRRYRLYVSRRLAIRARRADGAFQRLLHAFAGDGDQAEIVKLKRLRRGAVVAEFFLQGLHDALTVAALVHVDEVDDDDATEIAQADLADDFFDGIDIGLDDGVFETRRFADVLAGVDVDRDQRFGLVDDDVAAALEPDFRLERLVHLLFQAELFEQGRFFGVELYALHHLGLEAVEETEDALVLGFGVDPDDAELGSDLVA